MHAVPRNVLRTQCLRFRGLATIPNRQVRNPRQLFKPQVNEQKNTRPPRPSPIPIVPQALQAEFDKLLTNLDQAHKRKSLLDAHSQWSLLQSRGLLPHVPNNEFTSLNALLNTFTPTLLSPKAEIDISRGRARSKALQDVRDLAIILAAQAGMTGHLIQLMELSLREGRPEEVLDGWKKFDSLILPQPSSSNGEVPNQMEINTRKQLSLPILQAYAAQQDYRSAITSLLRRKCYRPSKPIDGTNPTEQFIQVVGAVAKIIGYGATREVLEKFTRGNNPKFAIHFYETLLSASQASENPWVFIAKERPSGLDEVDWATRPLFHVGEAAFAMFAAEFARCNRVDLAQRVADDMVSLGFTVPDPILNVLLDGYAKGRDFTAAGRIYALLTEGEKTPDVFAHTTLINALFQEGAVDDAMALFRKAETLFGGEGKEKGKGSLHVTTYNAVVHGLLINGRASDAEAIVDHLRNSTSGPKPDTITYNTLLRHYARKSDATNFVRTLQHLTSSGLEPDSYTYTTIVDTLLQSNRPDAVTRMLDVMEAAKIPANTATYTAIIDCLIRRKGERNIRAALQLVNKMEANGIHANE
ncbi:hypothetical protein FRC05_004565, partial [Tulasnella sp. 425]